MQDCLVLHPYSTTRATAARLQGSLLAQSAVLCPSQVQLLNQFMALWRGIIECSIHHLQFPSSLPRLSAEINAGRASKGNRTKESRQVFVASWSGSGFRLKTNRPNMRRMCVFDQSAVCPCWWACSWTVKWTNGPTICSYISAISTYMYCIYIVLHIVVLSCISRKNCTGQD